MKRISEILGEGTAGNLRAILMKIKAPLYCSTCGHDHKKHVETRLKRYICLDCWVDNAICVDAQEVYQKGRTP